MILTRLTLPRTYVHRVGFTQAVRDAARIPADPELLKIFQKIAPKVDWEKARDHPLHYEPPRWLGYWEAHEHCWASDGILKIVLQRNRGPSELFETLRSTHYAGKADLPFIGDQAREPSHMILHDSETWRVYVATFEQAEATLSRQARVPWQT